jgi:hypothetical protein
MSHKLNSEIAVIGIADIGNSAAIRFESALKASGRSPRFVRIRPLPASPAGGAGARSDLLHHGAAHAGTSRGDASAIRPE